MTETEYLLTCLMEELAETQQACSKAIRFGLNDFNPDTKIYNDLHIQQEFNDIMAIVEILNQHNIKILIDKELINKKKEKVEKMMNYSKNKGIII